MSEATSYNWKKKYAHLGVAELRELRQLREENGRLKRLVADLTLDKQKKALRPTQRRELANWLKQRFTAACRPKQRDRVNV